MPVTRTPLKWGYQDADCDWSQLHCRYVYKLYPWLKTSTKRQPSWWPGAFTDSVFPVPAGPKNESSCTSHIKSWSTYMLYVPHFAPVLLQSRCSLGCQALHRRLEYLCWTLKVWSAFDLESELSWRDHLCTRRFSQDFLVIIYHSLDPVAAIMSAKDPRTKSGSGRWRQLLNNRGQCWTVGNTC